MSSKLEITLSLPYLEVQSVQRCNGSLYLRCSSVRRPMACPACANQCTAIYDERRVVIRDEKVRNLHVYLEIWKKRYYCKVCKKPKTEPLDGILPRRRTTQRFRRWVMTLCSQFSDLKAVSQVAKCSSDFTYRAYYEQLDLEARKRRNEWPRAIGIDEHAFRKGKKYGGTHFVSMIVDHDRKRIAEVVEGKTAAALEHALAYIPGRERVQAATIDMCDPFKKFVRTHFPNAQIIADKFHVLRLLTPAITQERKRITGDLRTLQIRRDLLKNRNNLDYFQRLDLDYFLEQHGELKEIYNWKERLHGFYRIRGFQRAKKALKSMLDEMANSSIPAITKLRRTLQKWFKEILAYFHFKLTNARTEAFNNVAKTIKKRSYGIKSFKNYRLRVLNASF